MLADKRKEDRDACELTASIDAGDGRVSACLIADLSEGGAKLEIDPEGDLPRFFKLQLPATDDVRDMRDVELRWRYGSRAGVRFLR